MDHYLLFDIIINYNWHCDVSQTELTEPTPCTKAWSSAHKAIATCNETPQNTHGPGSGLGIDSENQLIIQWLNRLEAKELVYSIVI